MRMELTVKTVEKLKTTGKLYKVMDTEVPRFGVRVGRNGKKSYFVDYVTTDGRRRQMNIEKDCVLTATEARKIAKERLACVARGGDPLQDKREARLRGMKVEELWTRYADEYLDSPRPATRKGHRPLAAKTRTEYHRQWEKHLEKAFGRKRADSVTIDDVKRFHHKVGKKSPYLANRLVATLGSLFTFAEHVGVLDRGTNPARGLVRFEEKSHERFLSVDEMGRLGDVLRLADQKDGGKLKGKDGNQIVVKAEPWQAVAAVRLLLLTGMRKSEVLTMRWADVDVGRGILNLKDAKGGDRPVWLNAPALAVLDELPRLKDNPWVLPGRRPSRSFSGLQVIWSRLREGAGLDDVRLHDLRHSVGAEGRMAGLPLGILQGVLGHKESRTTERYAHIGQSPIQAGAETIGKRISEAMAAKDDETEEAEVINHPSSKIG